MKCEQCGGSGKVEKYFEAGDHFSAGSSPFSGWEPVKCDVCKGTGVKSSPKQTKICFLEGCRYRNTPGCRVHNWGVFGITSCIKYEKLD
jgi:hypothetical protein